MFDVHDELFLTFQEQDYANGFFDVIFHVDGKELYAHRAVLASASPVFKKQFLSSKSDEPVNQPIPIFDYSYDEFYEFLYFIYIPNQDPYQDDEEDCDPVFLQKNVYVLAELAHAYEIDCIKKICAQHLVGEIIDVRDDVQINETFVLAHKYLSEYENELELFLTTLPSFKEYNYFLNLDKSVMEAFIHFLEKFKEHETVDEDDVCTAVYKWGENQAMLDENMSKKEKNKLVKYQLKDFIPDLIFKDMSPKFLFEFAVENGLISFKKAAKFSTTQVTVKSGNKTLKGLFVDVYGILKFLQPHMNVYLKRIEFGNKFLRFSYPNFKIPSTPSTLQKMKGVEWYLLFDECEKLYIKHRTLVKRNDYLIAELKLLNTAENVNGSSLDESFVFDKRAVVSVSRSE